MNEYLKQAKQVIEIEREELKTLANQLDESFCEAIDTLKTTLHRKGKIVIAGIGKSGEIGQKITATLNSTGATAILLNTQNALHGDLGVLSKGDVIITLSYSGETEELINLLPYLKRVPDTTLIGITGSPKSSLAKHSDIFLNVQINREACPLNLAPTSSTTAMLAMGDALAMVLLQARGFTEEEFATYHPKGNLGKVLLTKASDIMRGKEDIAILEMQNTVVESLELMSAKRVGACIIIDENGKLIGLFTHGDFSRAFQHNQNIGKTTLECHMSKNPLSIKGNMLAVEAAKIVEINRVDEIVVIDEKENPIGLIDSQDFSRHKLI